MEVKKCRKCEAEIVWVTMAKTGAAMPLNYPPEKRVVIAADPNDRLVGAVQDTYTPHWATCPNAAEFKRG